MGKVKAAKPAVSGGAYNAPKGTTLPTDATTALASAFKLMGYASEDGLVNTWSKESTEKKAWGGETVLVMQNGVTDTFKITLIEATNEDLLKVVYGSGNVSGALSTGLDVEALTDESIESVWVFDMKLGAALKRIVVPRGVITEIGDITYKDSEAVGYSLTITALPDDDSSSNGATHYEYMKEA